MFFGTFVAIFKGGSSSGANSDTDKVQKREYYYADHLLKSGEITQEQYANGIALAETVSINKGKIEYQEELHKKDVSD